jgi:hypothetical protein
MKPVNSHIRDGQSLYSLCSRLWKHVGSNDPARPLCTFCVKERERRARKSGHRALSVAEKVSEGR